MRRVHAITLALAASLTLVSTAAPALAERPDQVSPTDAERVARAKAVHRRGKRLALRLSRRLNDARLAGDAKRAECVDRKLSQVNSTLRRIERRLDKLRDAVERGDRKARNHLLTVLGVLDARLSTLDRGATECEGVPAGRSGVTRVQVFIDPDVPREDPTELPAPGSWTRSWAPYGSRDR